MRWPATSAIKSQPLLREQRDAVGLNQPAAAAGPPSPENTLVPFPATVADHAGAAIDPPHPAVEPIGKNTGFPRDRTTIPYGSFIRALDGRPTVASKSRLADARDRSDRAGGAVDAADSMVECVGEIQIAEGVEGQVKWHVQFRGGSPGLHRRRRRAVPSRRRSVIVGSDASIASTTPQHAIVAIIHLPSLRLPRFKAGPFDNRSLSGHHAR